MQNDDHVLVWRAHKGALSRGFMRGSPEYSWALIDFTNIMRFYAREEMRKAS